MFFGRAWTAVLTSPSPSGTLNHLKETFTHTPSYDMSPAMLSMLIRLMLAQAQECLFEKTALPGIRNQFYTLMKMAQEAAKVSRSKTHTCSPHITPYRKVTLCYS